MVSFFCGRSSLVKNTAKRGADDEAFHSKPLFINCWILSTNKDETDNGVDSRVRQTDFKVDWKNLGTCFFPSPEMAAGMCVYLMIRRKKTTIFTDAKETTNVSELKKIIQGYS